MEDTAARAVAIVGVGAVLPEAPSAAAFWENVKGGRYCISDVTLDRWDPALYYDPDRREWALYALIPVGVGLAYLLYYAIAGRKEEEQARDTQDRRTL